MIKTAVPVAKPAAVKVAPAENKAAVKVMPSVQPMQLAADTEQQNSEEGFFEPGPGKMAPSSPFQFKSTSSILPPNHSPIQRKSSSTWAFQPKSVGAYSNSTAPVQRAAAPANKTGLPDNVKSGVEQLSGVSLGDVKVHYNSPKPAQLQAHAYAQGTDIHVASGQEKHVPHEAWHVVQQKQGRVQATTQMKGKVPVNDDAGLEMEADVMGAKAVAQGKMISNIPESNTVISRAVAQRVVTQFVWPFGGKKQNSEVNVAAEEQQMDADNEMKGLLKNGTLGKKGLGERMGLAKNTAINAGNEAKNNTLELGDNIKENTKETGQNISSKSQSLGGKIALGSAVAGGIGVGVSLATGNVPGAVIAGGLGVGGVLTGGVVAGGGTAVGEGVEAGGALVGGAINKANEYGLSSVAGMTTTAVVGIAEVLSQINLYISDQFDNIPVKNVVALVKGAKSGGLGPDTLKAAIEHSEDVDSFTGTKKGGTGGMFGDKDTQLTGAAVVGAGLANTAAMDINQKGNAAAEKVVEVVGSIIVGAVSTIKSIIGLFELFTKSGNKYEQTKKVAYDLSVATKAGFQIANKITALTGPFSKVIPGLSLAISICDTLSSIHSWRKAAEVEEEIMSKAEQPDNQPIIVDWMDSAEGVKYTSTLGEGVFDDTTLFEEDIRGKRGILDLFVQKGGKWSNLNKYVRVKMDYMSLISSLAVGGTPKGPKEIEMNNYLTNISEGGDVQNFCKALNKYQLASKLHEINNKRNIHGARETGANLISTAGAIAALVPADGGAVAAVLMGTGAGIKAGLAIGKALVSTKNGFSDPKKSSGQKGKEYAQHAITILEGFKDIKLDDDVAALLEDNDKLQEEVTRSGAKSVKEKIKPFVMSQGKAEKFLFAAGVNKAEFYSNESYGPGDFVNLANLIAKKLGEGR
jgi:hypothetical protein